MREGRSLFPAISLDDARPGFNLASLAYPDHIIVATTNPRRTRFVKDAFPGTPIGMHSVEPELGGDDVYAVMLDKLLKIDISLPKKENQIVFAADTRTLIPTPTPEDGVKLASKGKPKSNFDVFQSFQNILEASRRGIDPPHYQLESASGVMLRDQRQIIPSLSHIVVTFTKEGISDLATNQGFIRYLIAFNEFYNSPLYHSHHGKFTIFHLSGGVSLPVLVRMGYIESINGINADNKALFYSELLDSIHTAAIGIAPELLEHFGVKSDEILKEWKWLNAVAQRAVEAHEL